MNQSVSDQLLRIFLAVGATLVLAPSSLSSVLCGKRDGVFSAKLFAGAQLFTNSPTVYESISASSGGSVSHTERESSLDSSHGSLVGAELLYAFPRSRFSAGISYSYSSFDTASYERRSGSYRSSAESGSYDDSTSSLLAEDGSSVRLSVYYDMSRQDWRVRPYAIAAFGASGIRKKSSLQNLEYSGKGSGRERYNNSVSGVGTLSGSTSWVFSPELGLGLDVPLSKKLSFGSEVRFVPQNSEAPLPLQVLGYVKYRFVPASSGKGSVVCDVIEVKGESAEAVKGLLREATVDEIQELADYLKTKRLMNDRISP